MTWIKTISYEDSVGRLRSLYDKIKGPGGNVDNIMQAHSMRIHSMEGHLALYKAVLHHSGNLLEKWFLESLGLYVSLINNGGYCVEHHEQGIRRLLGDERMTQIRQALDDHKYQPVFGAKEATAMRYARKLTISPGGTSKAEIEELRSSGFDDGEILEINQVVSYFAYANRTVLGLGVTVIGDVLGLSPSSKDIDDWSHT